MASRWLIAVAVALLGFGACSDSDTPDEARIDLVADDRVFGEAAPGTEEESFHVSPAKETPFGQYVDGEVRAIYSGRAGLDVARWWFDRVIDTGWAIHGGAGVQCDRDSFSLLADKVFGGGDGDSFQSGLIVVIERNQVIVQADVMAEEVETKSAPEENPSAELADTCLGAD